MKVQVLFLGIMVCSACALAAGFDLKIEPQNLEVSLNEPVVIHATVTNLTEETAVADFGVGYVEAFRVQVVGPDGRERDSSPPPLKEGISTFGRVSVPATTSYSRPVILNEWYAFQEPGLYKVKVSLPGVGQSDINVTINPKDAERLRTVCAGLADAALEAAPFSESAKLFTRALSFAVDDEAVPYLRRVAEEDEDLASIAVEGLGRIGSRRAVDALQALAQSLSVQVHSAARYRLYMIKINTKDESLKQEIDAILAQP